MTGFKLQPILVLLLFVAAAFVVIGFLPSFIPGTNAFDRVEPAICKIVGAALLFGLTWVFIRRDVASRAMLDLRLTPGNLSILVLWTVIAGGVILLWLAVLRGFLPFHLEAGKMTAAGFALSLVVYLFGSIIEELAFRGYPFLRLRRNYGVVAAVMIVSIAFGLFHSPGILGLALLKIIAVTGLCSVIFCLGFLRTGTLWAAIGLHAGMNITMHSIFGAGDSNRSSVLRVVPDGSPKTWDAWFWSFMVIGTIAAVGIALSGRTPGREAESSPEDAVG